MHYSNTSKVLMISMLFLSIVMIPGPHGGHHGGRMHHSSGHWGHRGRHGGHWGSGFGISIGLGNGIGFGFEPGFWSRPAWRGWYGPYWGSTGLWLAYRNYWRHPKAWPQVYNETGERIKFYVSDRYHGRYTLTVVTENGQTETFTNLELPAMKNVEVFIDSSGQLQIAPR